MRINYLLKINLLVILLSCDNVKQSYNHPIESKLKAFGYLNYSLNIQSDSDFFTDSLMIKFSDTTNAKKIKSNEKDSVYKQIYNIKHARIDPNKNIYVQKNRSNYISVYDKEGKFLYLIGRNGNGPGEFTNLTTFEFNENYSKIFALDGLQIEVFERKLNNKFVYIYTVNHKLNMTKDLCLLNGKLYVYGFKYTKNDSSFQKTGFFPNITSSSPIHEIHPTKGEILNSFGTLYKSVSGAPPLDAILSNGNIECIDESEILVHSLNNFGFFFGYKFSGEHIWTSNINDFKFNTLVEKNINSPNPGIGFNNNDSFNILLPIHLFKNDLLITQIISSRQFQTLKQFKQIDSSNNDIFPTTVLIDSKTGHLFHTNTFYGRYMDSSKKNHIVLWDNSNTITSSPLSTLYIYDE